MNATVLRRFVVAAAVGTGFLVQPSESQAIFHWFKSCCQPAVPCAAPVQVAQYVPQVAYRTQYVNVPVTTYKPVTSCGPCGGQQVSYMPVTSYQTQPQLVPYTTYRIVYSNIVAAPAVVANYAPPAVAVAPAAPVAQASCCSPAASSTYYRAPGATTAYYGAAPNGYSAYSAPVYNGAGFGPPAAGLPVDNSVGNLMQSATTGSSLRGVSPTLSPGSPFANGSSSGAPMPMQQQMMPGQVMPGQMIQAPAAAQPMPGQYQSPSQPTPAPPMPAAPSPTGSQPQTYADENGTNGANGINGAHDANGTNGAAKPVTPNGNGDRDATETQRVPESPIQPIPHEEPQGQSADPTSGPSIFPPASRTTQSSGNQGWAYSRLSYLPGAASAQRVDRARTVPVDPRPAADTDGWRPASR